MLQEKNSDIRRIVALDSFSYAMTVPNLVYLSTYLSWKPEKAVWNLTLDIYFKFMISSTDKRNVFWLFIITISTMTTHLTDIA